MDNSTKKFNTKKALIVTLAVLIFIFAASVIGFLAHQNNSQKVELDKLNQDITSLKKEVDSAKKSENQSQNADNKQLENQVKTKEYTAGVNGEYKMEIPADWKVESKKGGDGRFSYYNLEIVTSSNRKIVLEASVNPPVGGAGGDNRPITVEKLADTEIDEYKVLQLTSDDGGQEIIVMAAKGGYGRLADGSWYRSFNKAISFQHNGNNHFIQFHVNGDTRSLSAQEKAEIVKVMSSFARR